MRRRHVIIRPEHDGVRARATAYDLISKCLVIYRSPTGRSSNLHRRGVETRARGEGETVQHVARILFGRRAANIACTPVSFLSMLFRRAASARASHCASKNRCRHAHRDTSSRLRHCSFDCYGLLWRSTRRGHPDRRFRRLRRRRLGRGLLPRDRCTTIPEGRERGNGAPSAFRPVST